MRLEFSCVAAAAKDDLLYKMQLSQHITLSQIARI